VMFFGAGFGQAINAVLRTQTGYFLNLAYLMTEIWSNLFRIDSEHWISVSDAWIALSLYCGICLFLLMRKVRAYEVVG
jgi:hypothetical protein